MMALSRRILLSASLALLTSVMGPGMAPRTALAADEYPSRPVTLLVPAAAGGTTDIVARLVAEGITKELGRQFIVENKGGASGNIGIRNAADADPDGYTLLVTFSGYQVTNPWLFKKPGWDPVKSFVPVGLVAKSPFLIIARKDLPVASLPELVDYARKKPGEVTYASSGQGSLQHIGAEQLQQLTGTKMLHVPYKGAGPAMTDLLGGVVDIYITSPPSAAAHLKSGGVKGLAMAAPERHPMLPEIPTAAEAGVAGLNLVSWYAVYAPVRTPQAIVDRLATSLEKIAQSGDFRDRLLELGAYPAFMSPQELGDFTRSEFAYWGEVITKAQITLE
jgi:tripartite-type tricarboxylate transporter receptor subunit TctC